MPYKVEIAPEAAKEIEEIRAGLARQRGALVFCHSRHNPDVEEVAEPLPGGF